MTNKEYVLTTMAAFGKEAAEKIQAAADEMTGTELYENEEFIPGFRAACAKMNMLQRPAGFTCLSTAGRVVSLIQAYDSDIYTQEPEELPAQWRFKWSKDPKKALPFIALSTSPYDTGDCCTENGDTWISNIDFNVYAPSEYPDGWTKYEEANK